MANRNYDTAKILIENGCDINAVNKNGCNALHISLSMYGAEAYDFAKLEELLINEKININALDQQGRSPLFYCFIKSKFYKRKKNAWSDPIEVLSFLLNEPKIKLDLQDNKKRTAMHYACAQGFVISVLSLLKKGAKHDIKDINSNVALGEAFLNYKMDVAMYLTQVTNTDIPIYQQKQPKELTVNI